ncbi:vesicle coat protein [Lithospermum erythrorhizon]|uniref:Protein transport protein SEC23 n=1 Tax=Lithospermum erythrorhizon TaxID=34254 RepID=A0AAV3Q8F9_LITER
MDFIELEAIEGLRWSWNAWPVTKQEASGLVIPLSIMCTPLQHLSELPILSYDPLICSQCGAVLNPYARVDYTSKLWTCPFCYKKNTFPRHYIEINENNIPAELFPTYSTVEYHLGKRGLSHVAHLANSGSGLVSPSFKAGFGLASPSFKSGVGLANGSFKSVSSVSSLVGSERGMNMGRSGAVGPAFVFVVDLCTEEEELRVLKNELLHIIARLPENVLVSLVVFDSMVKVYDLGFSDCLRAVLFHGERELSSEQTISLLGIHQMKQQHGKPASFQQQGFLLSISECEFNLLTAIEDIHSSPGVLGQRPLRSTGVAISVAVGLLEGCSVNTGSRIMVFTSGPATIGPGMIVTSDSSSSIRNHRDIINGSASYYKSCEFYKKISQRLSDYSIVLDLFACALDQVGAAELRAPIQSSGGFMILAESFESKQFSKCLNHIFSCDQDGYLRMYFDATIEVITTKDVKVCGALGSCVSLRKKNNLVSDKEVGEGGTYMWKLGSLSNRTCIAFIFELGDEQKAQPGSAFFVQFITRYRYGNMGIRKRVTTAARRWVGKQSPEIAAGFDQETAASVMSRLAIHRTESSLAVDVIGWLDKTLIHFAAKFGEYVPEDPSSFRLSSHFSLYPTFMYYLRRSQFIDVFNSSPDETAFYRLMLNREGVVASLIMVQPTLFQYSFDGPPFPVILDVRSVSPDVILLFDSYFCVVIHYGSNIAQWRKLGYDRDPNHESFRKLLEAPELDAEQLVTDRVPVPRFVKCDQHSSQARFLLAKLNPSITQDSTDANGSDVIFTDDVSLQAFIEHLQELAVQS